MSAAGRTKSSDDRLTEPQGFYLQFVAEAALAAGRFILEMLALAAGRFNVE